MWNDRYGAGGFSLWARANFDPGTMLMVGSIGLSAAGGAATAAGTLAGGDYAEQAGKITATQLRQNASQALASGQRQMFDTQLKTKLAISTARANAGASGVDAGVGSPLHNEGELEERGSYHALMDMFNGASAATGERNQADMAEWEGRTKRDASRLAAAGTLAATAGSAFSTYGKFAYPTARGSFGS